SWLANFVALALLLGQLGLAWVWYPQLPEQIPTHFGFTGKPDGWGPKRALWILPALSILLYFLISGLRLPGPRGSVLLPVLKAEMLATFLLIVWSQIQVAIRSRDRLSPAVWILLALTIATALLLR